MESGSEEAKKLLAAMQSDLYPMAPVVTYTATGRRFLEYRSVEGGQQGATSAVRGVPLACKAAFERARVTLESNGAGATLRAGVDDFIITSGVDQAYTVLERMREDLLGSGLGVQRGQVLCVLAGRGL